MVPSVRLAIEGPDGLADSIYLCLRHAGIEGQREAFSRVAVCNRKPAHTRHESGERWLGVQRDRIVQACFDTRAPQAFAQTVAFLASHDVQVEYVLPVRDLRQSEGQPGKSL